MNYIQYKKNIFDDNIMKLLREVLQNDEYVKLCDLLNRARYSDIIAIVNKLKKDRCIQKNV